ncbi:MAG: hypothetical protein PHH11_07655 [Methylomonas sp.]|nr:hypothetical protein [Methylomonas sp.]
MSIKLAPLVGLGLSLIQIPVHAAIIDDISQLPLPVQNCALAGNCLVESISAFDNGGIAAFRYQSADFSGYLFRYSVLPPSQASDVEEGFDYSQDPPATQHHSTNIPLAGTLWVKAAESYSALAASHEIVMYLDRATPSQQVVIPRWADENLYPTTLNFEFSTASLSASSANRYLALTYDGDRSSGDLVGNEALVPCLAEGCSVNQRLNLIGMAFVQVGNQLVLQFASDDTRSMLYSEAIAYNDVTYGFLHQRDWYVQPVPLPAAWLMWLSGFGLLAGIGKRRTA